MKPFIYVYSNDNILNLEESKELGFNIIEKSVQKFLEENKPHHFRKSWIMFILVHEKKLQEFSEEFLDHIEDFEFSYCENEIDWKDVISNFNNDSIITNGIIYDLHDEENHHGRFLGRNIESKTAEGKPFIEDLDYKDDDDDDDDDDNKISPLTDFKHIDVKNLLKETSDFISKKVKGQDKAVGLVSLCFANFIKSVQEGQPFSKHIILVGSSGSGKTEIARNLFDFIKEKKLNIETEKINASHITATGYRGINIHEKTDESGYKVFFIDELDKLFLQTDNEKDHYKEMIIADMLTVLENKKYFFIFAGVFKDLNGIIKENNPKEVRKPGFNIYEEKNEAEPLRTIDPLNQAITACALGSNEFIGRIPHIVMLNAINTEIINSILDGRINTFSSNLKSLGVNINIDEKCKKDILEIYSHDGLSEDFGVRYIDKIFAKIEEAVVSSESPQSELHKILNEFKSKLGIKQNMKMIHCQNLFNEAI